MRTRFDESDVVGLLVGAFAVVDPFVGGHVYERVEHRLDNGMTMAFCHTFSFAAVYLRYLRSAFVAKPGIMNTMEMAKPTISTVLSGKVLAMVLMAMLTTVDPT